MNIGNKILKDSGSYSGEKEDKEQSNNAGGDLLKSGLKGVSKLPQKTKKIIKVIKYIKTAITTFIALLKPILITFAVVIVISVLGTLISGIVSFFSGEEDETYLEEEYHMKLSEEEVKIVKGYSSKEDLISFGATINEQLRTPYKNYRGSALELQEMYGINAKLIMAICIEEYSTDADVNTHFADFFAKIGEKAEEWYDEGYISLHEIALDYVGDNESTSTWESTIRAKMKGS